MDFKIQDVEAADTIHQHLGQALVPDDGVDNEWVAPRSGDAGRVVTPVEGDRCARQMEELGDKVHGSADFPESHLVLTLGAVVLTTSEDHEVAVWIEEAAPILGRRSLIFGDLLIAVHALALAGLT
jgi:hypothetical protein